MMMMQYHYPGQGLEKRIACMCESSSLSDLRLRPGPRSGCWRNIDIEISWKSNYIGADAGGDYDYFEIPWMGLGGEL